MVLMVVNTDSDGARACAFYSTQGLNVNRNPSHTMSNGIIMQVGSCVSPAVPHGVYNDQVEVI